MTAVEDFDRTYLWHFRAQWLRDEYMDGDTFTVLTDNGHGSRYEPRIRLLGYNAAEWYGHGSLEATEALREVMNTAVGKWNLRIISQQRQLVIVESESFDRYPSLVWIVHENGDMTNLMTPLMARVKPRMTGVVGSSRQPMFTQP